MLRAVDASGIELVHHFRFRNFAEAELREKLRSKRQHQRIGGLERLYALKDRFHQRPADPRLAERLADRYRLHLHRRALG